MAKAQLAFPKGKTRQQVKAKKRRAESVVIASVRAACVERDGYCRVSGMKKSVFDVSIGILTLRQLCAGPSEWAHFGAQKRAKTRGLPAHERHTTAGSLMLCLIHHRAYDSGQMLIDAFTAAGCDGPLQFTRVIT